MLRAWPALAVLLCGIARGQALSYSAANIVNAANFTPGPFAPNSVLSLFGTNLCTSCPTGGVAVSETPGGQLPRAEGLAGVSVLVDHMPAPLLFVSATQINFLIPTEEIPGLVPVTVVRQGVAGPTVQIVLAAGAPALFQTSDGYALAEDWNNAYAVVTPAAPAHSGDVVIFYLEGLGPAGYTASGQVPAAAMLINNLSGLKVTVGGVALSPAAILYAGVTPGFAGLYQINVVLPSNLPNDPEVIVSIGNQSSAAGVKLALR